MLWGGGRFLRRGVRRACGLLVAVTICAIAATAISAAGGGIITTAAGTGTGGYSGDGGPATAAQLNNVRGVAATADGGFLIADTNNHVIRRVSPSGTITTVAGNGTSGYSGDGGPATAANLGSPVRVSPTADGGFLIADVGNPVVRRVAPDGTITTVAGTGTPSYSGDGGPATAADLDLYGVSATADGGFLIADQGNNRIRRVSPGGIITTVAGNGTGGFSGDGGPATAAELSSPSGVAATPDGGFLIADLNNQRIRRVAPDGTITTVAGNGATPAGGFSGDGGPATAAQLASPEDVAITSDGGFLIADVGNDRVRSVSPSGTITTVAGGGNASPGDGGPATDALLENAYDASGTVDGGFLIAEDFRIRHVSAAQSTPPPPSGPAPPVLGQSVDVAPVAGRVLIKVGAKPFVPLTSATQIPVGSTLDTTNGRVSLTSAADSHGTTQSAIFYSGLFVVHQKQTAHPITELALTGNLSCTRPPSASAARRRRRRSLWGSGKGRFRTSGSYASATVRGTIWLTEDTCNGTLVSVRSGVVTVRDFVLRKSVVIRAGQSYLAHAA